MGTTMRGSKIVVQNYTNEKKNVLSTPTISIK